MSRSFPAENLTPVAVVVTVPVATVLKVVAVVVATLAGELQSLSMHRKGLLHAPPVEEPPEPPVAAERQVSIPPRFQTFTFAHQRSMSCRTR
jgi:hypothetical protein